MRLTREGFCSALLSCVVLSNPALAVVGGEEPKPSDTRFDAVAAFSITTWIDGTVYEHNTFGNGTLIAPDTMILAKHLVNCGGGPPVSGTYSFRFRRNPDGTLGSKAQGWESFHQVEVESFTLAGPNADILIAHLAEDVTHIAPIEVIAFDQVAENEDILIAGWGMEGPGQDEGDRGRLLLAETQRMPHEECHRIHFLSAWDQSNPCSCGPNLYDSGGAILVEMQDRSVRLIAVVVTTTTGVVAEMHPLVNPCYSVIDCPLSVTYSGCADLNDDGIVDAQDQAILLGNWGTCIDCADCQSDISGDCKVDVLDLTLLLSQWGEPCDIPCIADLDGDGMVGPMDEAIVLGSWGVCDCQDPCDADLTGDHVVDSADMAIILGNWGPCP